MSSMYGVPDRFINNFDARDGLTFVDEEPSTVPMEYLHCFNVNDEIEENQETTEELPAPPEQPLTDLYGIAEMEWIYYVPEVNNASNSNPTPEPAIKRLMDLGSWEESRREIESMDVDRVAIREPKAEQKEKDRKKAEKKTSTQVAKVRGPYRTYTTWQIQELLDLVLFAGMSARQASLRVGIVVRTGQNYVRQYRLQDDPEYLPGQKNNLTGGNNKKFEIEHTKFLMNYFDNNAAAMLWEARDALCPKFHGLSVSLSSVHRHLVLNCCLIFKKLERLVEARNAERTITLRKTIVADWINGPNMDYQTNCVFVDEAGFNMHLRRNFGRSKKGVPAKVVVPTNRGITISIIGAICEKGVIDLTLRKPKAIRKTKEKKRKRNDNSAETSEELANARIGTRSEHYLEFISGVMDCIDRNSMQDKITELSRMKGLANNEIVAVLILGRHIVMDNASIHTIDEVTDLIEQRGYKAVYLPPYSPFLNPIEEFWSKVKAGVKRDCLTVNDNLSDRITASAKKVTQSDVGGWIRHSITFFDRCLAGELNL